MRVKIELSNNKTRIELSKISIIEKFKFIYCILFVSDVELNGESYE